MKRMLINATHSEEIRVALADGQKLYNLDIDIPGQDRKKGNIYKGRITRVEPSLEAAFVDYGAERHGFLPYKEISRNYYTDAANKAKERPPIAKAIKEGTEVIIQVNKEERGNKGAAISTYISLAGRYMVYMPENPKAGGISRRIEGAARQQLKETLSEITLPKNSGIIVRTAGIGRSTEEIRWDLNYLDQVWTAIKTAATVHKAPHFLYQESDIFIRALRDYLRPDVSEILIDDKRTFEKARDFMQQVMPHNLKKLSFYDDTIPLFSRYQIESQIQSAFSREVQLPSGGSLVIDHTEALISIDINSARATKGADIEETALNTNLESADEIARQLRIRDLGGLIVIDFIDMRNHKNQRLVEQQLNEAVSNDRARVQTSKISRFGLLEMSRQRLKSSINESSQFVCPRCSGHGFIRNIESLSVSILRLLEEEALKPETGKVVVQVPTKVANFIINEKRQELNNLEQTHSVPMLVVANEYYQSPQFDVKRLKKSEAKHVDLNNVQLNKPENEEQAENNASQKHPQKREHAAVDLLVPESQAPERGNNSSLVSWFKGLFSNSSNTLANTEKKSRTTNKKTQHHNKKTNKNNHHNKTATKKQQPKHAHNNKPQPQKLHNKQQNKVQHNKAQKNKAPHNKTQSNKTTKVEPHKQTQTQHNKAAKTGPQKQKQHNKATKAEPQKQTQQNKAHKEQKPNTSQALKNNPAQKAQKTETINNDDQILQRPLGSVASYAAKKAQNPSSDATAVKKSTTDIKHNNGNPANKANTNQQKDTDAKALKTKHAESAKIDKNPANNATIESKKGDTQKSTSVDNTDKSSKITDKNSTATDKADTKAIESKTDKSQDLNKNKDADVKTVQNAEKTTQPKTDGNTQKTVTKNKPSTKENQSSIEKNKTTKKTPKTTKKATSKSSKDDNQAKVSESNKKTQNTETAQKESTGKSAVKKKTTKKAAAKKSTETVVKKTTKKIAKTSSKISNADNKKTTDKTADVEKKSQTESQSSGKADTKKKVTRVKKKRPDINQQQIDFDI